MCSSNRGQSEVIGLILLLGLSMVIIGGTVVMGGSAISDRSTQFDSENAKNSISNVESEMSAVGIGSAEFRTVGVSQTADGIYYVAPDEGSVTITYTVDGTEEWNITRSLGTIVHNGSQRDVAYQGGGVWVKEGNFTDVVSSPEYHYRDNSLVFPILQVTAPNSGVTEYGNVEAGTELESNALDYPLTEGTVKITVHSQYYQGWHTFFKERTDGNAALYHENNTAVTELVVPDSIRLDNTLSLESTYDPGNGGGNTVVPPDELEDNVPHPSADSLIEQELSDASSDNDNSDHACVDTSGVDSGCSLTSGTYYINSDMELDGDLTLDVSGGDITIATEGKVDIGSNSVSVVGGSENTVEYYINGSLRGSGNGEIKHASGGDSTQNQIFVADSFLDESTGSGTVDFEAIIYAPDADVETGGNFAIRGALIAYDLNVNGNAGEIRRGDVPEDYVLDVTGTSDTIQYLHITTNRVTAELQNSNVVLSKYKPQVSNECDWVESKLNSGDFSMSGENVECDVDNGISGVTVNNIDFDSESVLIGQIDVEGNVDLDTSQVTDGITTDGQDITITSDSIVGGDVVAPDGTNIDIDGGSTVEGAVVAKGGSLSLDNSIINGQVYVEEDDISSCTGMEIGPNGETCGDYEFRDPSNYQ